MRLGAHVRVTCFTSNQPRHIGLLDALVAAGHKVVAVIEPKSSVLPEAEPFRAYWQRVREAEWRTFPRQRGAVITAPCVVLRPGDVSRAQFPNTWIMDADRFVVFSASYITGTLATFLVAQQALNLHVGIAPEYRGSAPNAWAAMDGRHDLVGAQVQRLSTGLDMGDILAEVRPPMGGDPFLRGMQACQLGIMAMVTLVAQSPKDWTPVRPNDKAHEIAYRRHEDFTPQVVETYLRRLDASA